MKDEICLFSSWTFVFVPLPNRPVAAPQLQRLRARPALEDFRLRRSRPQAVSVRSVLVLMLAHRAAASQGFVQFQGPGDILRLQKGGVGPGIWRHLARGQRDYALAMWITGAVE